MDQNTPGIEKWQKTAKYLKNKTTNINFNKKVFTLR